MTPTKIKEHEPTAVSREPNDQTIVSGGQTGTDSPEALEQYRRQGMTKVGENNTTTTGTSVGQQQSNQTTGGQQQGNQTTGGQQQGNQSDNPLSNVGEAIGNLFK